MEQPKVHNKYHKTAPPDAVYIGRGSHYGNPFTHLVNTKATTVVDDRDQACDEFEKWASSNPLFIADVKQNLRGKHLVCFCKPKRCHGDFLLKIANE